MAGEAPQPRSGDAPTEGRGHPAVLVRRAWSVAVLWDILVSIFWFMLLFVWIWLLVTIFGDLFRDHEMSGWGKAFWVLFLIVIPWLGALVYLIARGSGMRERALAQQQEAREQLNAYVRETAGGGSPADELTKLAKLHDERKLSDAEF